MSNRIVDNLNTHRTDTALVNSIAKFKELIDLNEAKADITGEKVQTHLQPLLDLRLIHGDMLSSMSIRGMLSSKFKGYGKILEPSSTSTSHGSNLPFERLSQTSIRNLLVNIKADGFYLLLRTIAPPLQTSFIQTIVEDHLGNVIFLVAYFFTDPGLDSADVFPLGTVLAIKEPIVKRGLNGHLEITCECPSDIIVVGRHHKIYESVKNVKWRNILFGHIPTVDPTTAEDWKLRGNAFYGQKKYNFALEAYLVGLKLSNSTESTSLIHLNLAATYLTLGYFELCLKSAQIVLNNDENNSKALFRAGKACFKLRNFEEAKQYFQKFLGMNNINMDAAEEARLCVKRIQRVANPDLLSELINEARKKPKSRLDYPDFVGSVEIAEIQGKGRGVIATSDIQAGQLLIISKAVAVAFLNPSGTGFQVHNNKDLFFEHHVSLVAQLTQTVLKNPNTIGKQLYKLTSSETALDENGKTFCYEDEKEELITDVERIRKILMINSFELISTNPKKFANEGTAVFLFPSYLNHSCVPNAGYKNYNDVLVIHAIQSIPRGQEVTVHYLPTDADFLTRESMFNTWNFECDCVLCILDRRLSSSAHSKIQALIFRNDELDDEFDQTPVPQYAIKKQIEIIRELIQVYENENRIRLKFPFFAMYKRLAFTFSKQKNLPKTIKAIENAFKSVGLNVGVLLEKAKKGDPNIFPQGSMTYCYDTLGLLAVAAILCYNTFDRLSEVKEWFQLLVLLQRVCCCGDLNNIKEKYKDLPRHLFSD